MYRIIDSRGNGKTLRLMLIAKETGAAYVCANPEAMRNKAYSYGITGINFISYNDFVEYSYPKEQEIVIDDLEKFAISIGNGRLIGFTVSKD